MKQFELKKQNIRSLIGEDINKFQHSFKICNSFTETQQRSVAT